jgi:hypothetical protein
LRSLRLNVGLMDLRLAVVALEKLAALRRLGWRVRVVWECQVESGAFRRGLCAWLTAGLPARR